MQSQLLGAVLRGHFTPRALRSQRQALSRVSGLGHGSSSQTWPQEGRFRGHQTEPRAGRGPSGRGLAWKQLSVNLRGRKEREGLGAGLRAAAKGYKPDSPENGSR